ncbi:MAG: septum formation initiator family protein [Elusimicrobia bacterium]|nr:septum formation initiator family protein [Candidatus Obscuribacterium magneticum]
MPDIRPYRKWFFLAAVLFFLASLFFNVPLRKTIARHRAIGSAERELQQLSEEIDRKKMELARLKSSPQLVEEFVRRELGYLRPGEKEVRFLKKDEAPAQK